MEPRLLLVVGALGLAAVVLAAVALPEDTPAGVAIARLSGVVLPVGFGLLRLARRRDDRFALLLVGAGALWSVTTLAESSASLPYSVGRVAVWLVEPAIAFLLLSFPSGRLAESRDRRLVASIALLALVLYVPTALLAPFPEPSPWTTCPTAAACPHDAFLLGSHASGLVDGTIRPLREVATVVLFAVLAIVVVRRAVRASPYLRLRLVPVAGVAGLHAVTFAIYFLVRRSGSSSPAADVLGWLFVLALPIITLAFGAGILLVKLFTADALTKVTGSLSTRPSAHQLRHSLAAALGDPSLDIVIWHDDEQSWVDVEGALVPDPAQGLAPGRCVLEVSESGRRLGAVIHDAELAGNGPLLEGARALFVAAHDNDQLVSRLQDSLHELALSRARLVSVADEERHRIERDLHDGAQQQLVALQIKLDLLADGMARDSPGDAAELRALERDIGATIDEVRRFGRGVYPPLLADRGIRDALLAVARVATIPTTVEVRLSRRYSLEAESAVYFCCVEALQNACKHASGASRVTITVAGGPDRLRFEVRDDGAGFRSEHVSPGAGLTNIRDRLGAVGGSLELVSHPGSGTRVIGTILLGTDGVRAPGRPWARTEPRW